MLNFRHFVNSSIYVLTHCGQVEPEQLPDIEKKFRSDLEKAIGFAPEQIFCVDSVTYWDGKSKNAPLLVEDSGVLPLQKALSERLAGAAELLEQAQKAELQTRREDLLECLNRVEAMVRDVQNIAAKKQQTQIAAVDTAWAKFENGLKKVMPGSLGKYVVYGYFNLPRSSRQYGDAKSKSEAKQKLESCLRSTYNARERVLREQVRNNMESLRKEYCSAGLDSAYFSKCNAINRLFEQTSLEFQQLGISGFTLKEISVSPNLPSDLASQIEYELADDVVRTDGCYSLSRYIDIYSNIHDMDGQYITGLFGIQVKVPWYTYDAGDAVREMEKDMEQAWSFNAAHVRNMLNRYWEDFCKEVKMETAKRKNEFKKRIDAYRASLIQASGTESTSAALEYLGQIEQEARA